MSAMSFEFTFPRRRAKARLRNLTAGNIGLLYNTEQDLNEYDCFVLLATHDGDEPVFVCEFLNGAVLNVYTERVRFVDTEEGMIK